MQQSQPWASESRQPSYAQHLADHSQAVQHTGLPGAAVMQTRSANPAAVTTVGSGPAWHDRGPSIEDSDIALYTGSHSSAAAGPSLHSQAYAVTGASELDNSGGYSTTVGERASQGATAAAMQNDANNGRQVLYGRRATGEQVAASPGLVSPGIYAKQTQAFLPRPPPWGSSLDTEVRPLGSQRYHC